MNIVISDTTIRQDSEGRYCLNDLHRSAGGEARHKPGNWLANQQTQELIDEINSISGIPAIDSRRGRGDDAGTFVCKELVYSYAMWISPVFSLKVIRTFDAVSRGAVLPATLTRMELIQLAMDAEKANLELAHKVTVMAPKVEAYDRLCDEEGLVPLNVAASVLKMKQKKFFIFLREIKWVFKRRGHDGEEHGGYVGYAPFVPRYLVNNEYPYKGSDGQTHYSERCRLTREGLAKLAKKLNMTNAVGDYYNEIRQIELF
jgi:hypothetical protein